MATIKFIDGTIITAELNGTCYIVDEKPDFPSDLSVVEIESENGTEVVRNAQIMECKDMGEKFWFIIIHIPQEEQNRADIDYIAAMTDIEL